MDLFEQHRDQQLRQRAPLADRMRPRTLEEYIGQEHIIGPGRLLRRAIQIDQLSSVIFYGPPGTGKTTLARIIANTTKSQFLSINAVLAGVKDIRDSIELAKQSLELYAKKTILFVDEVHRFNKAQQDALLPHVENGLLILIGATTENPYFEVNKALVSRSRIFQLKSLTCQDLIAIAHQALADKERGYGQRNITIDDDALEHLVQVSSGDARGVLNALELAVETTPPAPEGLLHITRSIAEESIQMRAVLYDKDGDAHYDTISAFIKSLRGSDPDAALYWMAKMVYAGEDARFILRRMLIFAAEDIGMADPRALQIVAGAAQAFDYVGMPEGRFHLAQACLYCATAPKSNTTFAFFDALDVVGREARDEVPKHLRDASRDKDGLGDGEGYLYPHAYRDHWVAQQYLPSSLMGKMFYQPSEQGYEKGIAELVAQRREAQLEAMVAGEQDELFGSSAATSPAQWAQRTSGSAGAVLSTIRSRIMELAAIGRDELVLDLHARTGLLTFAAARAQGHAGIWSLAHDKKSFETISSMSAPMESLQRPQVVLVNWDNFSTQLRNAAGETIRFDKIIGRNILGPLKYKEPLIKAILELMSAAGCSVLAETVQSQAQRIGALVELDKLGEQSAQIFREVEEQLFANPVDARVNWDAQSLAQMLSDAGAFRVRTAIESETTVRRLSGTDVQYWFRQTAPNEPDSLGERLMKRCSPEDVEHIRTFLLTQLTGRSSSWKTVLAYFKITRA